MYNSIRYKTNKEAWNRIIHERGLDRCSVCGYNKEFGVIDFHHTERAGSWKYRKVRISYLITQVPTEERVKKLDDVIPLCANCHRELHIKLKNVGKRLVNKVGDMVNPPLFEFFQ